MIRTVFILGVAVWLLWHGKIGTASVVVGWWAFIHYFAEIKTFAISLFPSFR